MALPQGINDANFYQLIDWALKTKGVASLEDFFKRNPDYWFNEEIWETLFPLEQYPNETRSFQQQIGQTYIPVMATYLADEAETPIITNEGIEKKTGEIPRMGNGYLFTAKNYEDARKIAATYGIKQGADAVYEALFLDTRNLIQSIHAQRSFTAEQVESKGYYLSSKANNVGGFENFKIDMNVPVINKKKAGGYGKPGYIHGTKYAWTDENANPLGDLRDMWHYAWTMQVLPQDKENAVFRMNIATFEILKGHPSTKAAIGLWKTGYLVSLENLPKVEVTDDDLARYMNGIGLPIIETSKYFGFTNYLDAATQKVMKNGLSAFADNTVVLRKKDTVGSFQWYKVSNIFATDSSRVYYTNKDSMAIQEDTASKRSGLKMSINSLCVPVPRAVQAMLYLTTNEAAA